MAEGVAENPPEVRESRAVWSELRDLHKEIIGAPPEVAPEIWTQRSARQGHLAVLDVQLSMLTHDGKAEVANSEEDGYTVLAAAEEELRQKQLRVLDAVDLPFYRQMDATRLEHLGTERGFADLDHLRLAAADRVQDLLAVDRTNMPWPVVDRYIRRPLREYLRGLSSTIGYQREGGVGTGKDQRAAASDAAGAFQSAVSVSDNFVTRQRVLGLAAAVATLQGLPDRVSQLDDAFSSVSHAVSQLRSELSGQLEVLDLGRFEELHASTSEAVRLVQHASEEQATSVENEIARLREEATKKSVAEHAATFKDQAQTNQESSTFWLRVTMGLGVFAAGATWLLFADVLFGTKDTSTRALVSDVVIRGTAISMLVALFQVARRMFYAQTHLAAVNRHRQRSLESFDRFYEQASDQATKDAVLSAATRAIFEQTQTGFLGKVEAARPANPISDLVKLIIPPKAAE